MTLSKKGRYVYCADCGCRLEMNGICQICGHEDSPLLPGMVPDLIGQTQAAAAAMLTDPEAQLTLGTVTEEHSDTVAVDLVISCDPTVDTELDIGTPVNLVVSLGPAI